MNNFQEMAIAVLLVSILIASQSHESWAISNDLGNSIHAEDQHLWYPSYHLAPRSGWMNDPNGLIWFNGYYHAFYQHNPNEAVFRTEEIGWGHARSTDMVHWEYLPMALKPSIDVDKKGCYSGSAINDNGTMKVLYTCNVIWNVRQVMCLASSNNTIDFVKYGQVLDSPPNISDFRDPKVWKEENAWYMVVGTRQPDNEGGKVNLYKSDNLLSWQYESTLVQTKETFAHTIECPDLFAMDGDHVLIFSSPIIKEGGLNRSQTGYFIGSWEPGHEFKVENEFAELDYGHDFYASQTFVTPDGRRIVIGWMGHLAPVTPLPEQTQNWCGMLTMPRELSLWRPEGSDGRRRLRVLPIREIEKLRQNPPVRIGKMVLNSEHVELDKETKAMEIHLTWNRTASSGAEKYGIRLGDKEQTEDDCVLLYVDTRAEHLVLDRRYSRYELSGSRYLPLPTGESLILRVFFDSSSLEVFVNDGYASMTSRIYPENDKRVLSLFAQNGSATLEDGSHWILKRNDKLMN